MFSHRITMGAASSDGQAAWIPAFAGMTISQDDAGATYVHPVARGLCPLSDAGRIVGRWQLAIPMDRSVH